MNKSTELFEGLVAETRRLELDNPIGYRNLTLVPLSGPTSQMDYILAADALADGSLIIREVSSGGLVNTLMAENKSSKRILLLDGEELVGAKQNRILNTTILIEAYSTLKIPVSCVEQGRWRYVSNHFSSGVYCPPEIRLKKSQAVSRSYARSGQPASNQCKVWEDVEMLCRQLNVQTPTMAMKDVFDQRSDDVRSYLQALPYPKNARGVIAAVSGRFVALDALDKPSAFERIWNRLVAGYAADALRGRQKEKSIFNEKAARFFIDSIADCTTSVFPGVGLGQELRFESSQITGQALVVDDCLVHLSVFGKNEPDQHGRTNEQQIMPPSYRARRRNFTEQ